MINLQTHRYLIVLVVTLLGSLSWAGEPNEVPIHLEFEVSPTPLGPYIASSMGPEWRSLFSYRPAYAVAIPLVSPIDWLPSPARGTMDNFVGNTESRSPNFGYAYQPEAGLSEPQKAFLQAHKGLLNNARTGLLMDRPDPNGPPRVLLYALTLDDAKRMAQAYFQYARNDWWRGYFDSLVKKAQVNASNVARYQTRLAEIDKRVEVAQKPLEELQKTVPYRTESEAHEAVVELDRMLNAARVEIAGITAKIEAIQGYRWDKPEAWQVIPRRAVPEEAIARLNMMFVEETIALRGAEARKQTATNLREQANRFLDLKSTLTSAAAEKKPLMEDLKDNQNNLASYQRELEVLRQEEPKIPAKVVIYPVQWANKPSQN